MKQTPAAIPGLVYLDTAIHRDPRGSFMVGWRTEDLATLPDWRPFVQESLSQSRRGVLRGLHLQHRHPQGKLVRVLSGEIYDVAVDLRADSSTRGKWVGAPLKADGRALWIPPGFAHGFLVRSEQATVLYQVTDIWAPNAELTVRWDDPTLAIDWPMEGPPVLSQRDAAAPLLSAVEHHLSQP